MKKFVLTCLILILLVTFLNAVSEKMDTRNSLNTIVNSRINAFRNLGGIQPVYFDFYPGFYKLWYDIATLGYNDQHSYSLNDTSWVTTSSFQVDYLNNLPALIYENHYYSDGEDHYKFNVSYDSFGKPSQIIMSCLTGNNWYDLFRERYIYDENGVMNEFYNDVNNSDTWSNRFRTLFVISNGNIIQYDVKQYNYDSNQWTNWVRNYAEWSEDELVRYSTYWWTGADSSMSAISQFSYDPQGKLSIREVQFFTDGQYQNSDRVTYNYQNELYSGNVYESNSSGQWTNVNQIINIYDENRLSTSYFNEWNDSDWDTTTRTEFSYEVNNQDSENPVNESLLKIFPNPFNPSTKISFTINNSGLIKLDIYDIKGRLVKNQVHEFLKPGSYTSIWSGTDNSGKTLSSGVYFVRLKANTSQIRKVLLLK